MKLNSKIIFSFLLIHASINGASNDIQNLSPIEQENQALAAQLKEAQEKIQYLENLLTTKNNVIIISDGIVNLAPSAKNLEIVAFGGIINIGIISEEINPNLISVNSQGSGIVNVGTVVADEKTMNDFKDFFTSKDNSDFFNAFNAETLMQNFEK